MKVLILTPNYPRKDATANGIFIHQQVKALQKLGVECHVLLLHVWYPTMGLHKYNAKWRQGHAEKQNYFSEYEGVKIHSVPMFIKLPTRFFKETFYERAMRALEKYIKGNAEIKDADWMYAHFYIDMGYFAAMIKQRFKIKVATICRGDDVHAWPETYPSLIEYLKYTYAHADLLLANNRRLAKDALKYADAIPPRIGVVYNGINYYDFGKETDTNKVAATREKYGLPAKKKLLLCIGRNEYLKGWKELLGAVAENKALLNDWVLVAITSTGGGPFAVDVPALLEELQIGSNAVLKSFLPFEQIKEIYSAVDAFILPSYNEGISNAVMEAMASGLWTIASDVGGHAEIMEHGVSGFLIAPRSQEAVSESLQYMVANYDSRNKQISADARQAMERLGDYKQNAQKLVAMLQAGKVID